MSTAEKLEKILKQLAEEDERGGGPRADKLEEQALDLKQRLKKEERELPAPHPA